MVCIGSSQGNTAKDLESPKWRRLPLLNSATKGHAAIQLSQIFNSLNTNFWVVSLHLMKQFNATRNGFTYFAFRTLFRMKENNGLYGTCNALFSPCYTRKLHLGSCNFKWHVVFTEMPESSTAYSKPSSFTIFLHVKSVYYVHQIILKKHKVLLKCEN